MNNFIFYQSKFQRLVLELLNNRPSYYYQRHPYRNSLLVISIVKFCVLCNHCLHYYMMTKFITVYMWLLLLTTTGIYTKIYTELR